MTSSCLTCCCCCCLHVTKILICCEPCFFLSLSHQNTTYQYQKSVFKQMYYLEFPFLHLSPSLSIYIHPSISFPLLSLSLSLSLSLFLSFSTEHYTKIKSLFLNSSFLYFFTSIYLFLSQSHSTFLCLFVGQIRQTATKQTGVCILKLPNFKINSKLCF